MTGWKTWKVGLGLGFLSFEFQQNFMKRPFPKILSLKNRAVFMFNKLCLAFMQEFERMTVQCCKTGAGGAYINYRLKKLLQYSKQFF